MTSPEPIGPRAQRLIRSVVTGGGSQAVILVLSFLVTPILVFALGMERYGLWALAGVLVNYVGLFDLGFGTSLLRFLAVHHGHSDELRFNTVVRMGLLFYGGFAALVFPLAILLQAPVLDALQVSDALRGEVAFLLLGVLAILLVRSIFVVFRAAIASVERIDVNNRIAMVVAVPSSIGAVTAVYLGYGLRGLTINGLFIAALTVLLQTIAAYRHVPLLRLFPWRLDWAVAPELFVFGLRMQATRIAELLNGHVDKLILAVFVGATSVGLYDLGLKVALLAAVAPGLLLPVVLPTAAVLVARGDRSQLEALHRRTTKYLGLVLAPAVVFLLVACPALLAAWIGPTDLNDAVVTARLMIVGLVPMLALGGSRLIARGVGLPQMEMWASLLMAGTNVILSVTLVRWFGFIGAPIGSCLAGLVGGAVFLVSFRRHVAREYHLDPVGPLRVPAMVAAGAGLLSVAALQVAHLFELPAGRSGALLEMAVAAVPFLVVYGVCVVRGLLLDEYDQNLARQTWTTARSALGQPEVSR